MGSSLLSRDKCATRKGRSVSLASQSITCGEIFANARSLGTSPLCVTCDLQFDDERGRDRKSAEGRKTTLSGSNGMLHNFQSIGSNHSFTQPKQL